MSDQADPSPTVHPELASLQQETSQLKEQLVLAVSKYRQSLLARFPEVPEELVSGDSLEAIDASLVAARGLVDKVRAKLATQASAERVPAGAPARSSADISSLSPGEKIAYALSRGR